MARDEDHLTDILDEVGDIGCARWAVYKGPLWIDLDLPTIQAKGSAARAVDAEAVLSEGSELYRMRAGDSETGHEMLAAVTRWALPHVHAVLEARSDEDLADEELSDEAEAIRELRWRERLTGAVEADEAEMTLLLHKRREAEAQSAGPGQYVTQAQMQEAVSRIGQYLAAESPVLRVVSTDGESDDGRESR